MSNKKATVKEKHRSALPPAVLGLGARNSFAEAVEFFMSKIEVPMAYFEYQSDKACLVLKHTTPGMRAPEGLCIRLYESDPSFNPTFLYRPKQIPVFHSEAQKLFEPLSPAPGTATANATTNTTAPDYECFPLVFNRQPVGVFVYSLDSASKDSARGTGDMTNTKTAIENRAIKDQLCVLSAHIKNFLWREKWERASPVDALTGCLNEKALLKRLFIEFSRARRLLLPLSLIVIELDQFKELESTYSSYEAGLFIKSLVNNLIKDSRTYDIFGALPEGRLAVVLPHTSERSAGMKAEKIRWSVQSADFSKVFASHGRLTLSLGLAEYPRVTRSAEALLQSALKALSFAREECCGNMTAVATPPVGFKPDFTVQNTLNHLRDLT